MVRLPTPSKGCTKLQRPGAALFRVLQALGCPQFSSFKNQMFLVAMGPQPDPCPGPSFLPIRGAQGRGGFCFPRLRHHPHAAQSYWLLGVGGCSPQAGLSSRLLSPQTLLHSPLKPRCLGGGGHPDCPSPCTCTPVPGPLILPSLAGGHCDRPKGVVSDLCLSTGAKAKWGHQKQTPSHGPSGRAGASPNFLAAGWRPQLHFQAQKELTAKPAHLKHQLVTSKLHKFNADISEGD